MTFSENNICQEIEGEVGEKIVVLRHDVDNIYSIYSSGAKRKFIKLMNYGFLALLTLTPNLRHLIPYYERHLFDLLDIEKSYGARATYFFRIITLPKSNVLNRLLADHHELGYHSDRNRNFKEWYSDLKYIERSVGVRIKGFTKHGHSIVRDGGPWDEEKFIGYAVKARVKYLAQGENHPKWKIPNLVKGVWVFGHHITLKKISINGVKKYLEECIPLVLIHPEDVFMRGEERKLEYILSRRKGVSVNEALNIINKVTQSP